MNTEIVCTLLSLGGTLIGSFTGIMINASKTEFRLKQLEDKISMYNNHNNRISILEVLTKELQDELKNIKKGD